MFRDSCKNYNGKRHYYASLVKNKRIDGKVVQIVKAILRPVTEDQISFLKVTYTKNKLQLVYDEPSVIKGI